MAEDDYGTLLTVTADIVAAHVSNNTVAVNDLPNLVQQVHDALSRLGAPAPEPEAQRREPMVSPRSAIKPDSITCLACGLKSKMLKRHLMTAHQMTPSDYRGEFGLKADYPMVAPNYAELRRDLAKRIGLGTKGRTAKGTATADVGGGKAGARRGRKKAEPAEV